MDFVLVFYVQIIFLLDATSSQYEYQNVQYPYQNIYQNAYPMIAFDTQNEYEEPHNYQQSKKYKSKPYVNSGGRLPLEEDYSNDESEECKCSCNRCEDPEPCCKNVCANCNTHNQQNLVIVPYPYPLIVTPEVVTEITTTTTSNPVRQLQNVISTESSKQVAHNTSPKPETLCHKANYVLTSLRRTKPVWMPKYGIVPIPDRLAEKLMSKLSEIKGLKAERQ